MPVDKIMKDLEKRQEDAAQAASSTEQNPGSVSPQHAQSNSGSSVDDWEICEQSFHPQTLIDQAFHVIDWESIGCQSSDAMTDFSEGDFPESDDEETDPHLTFPVNESIQSFVTQLAASVANSPRSERNPTASSTASAPLQSDRNIFDISNNCGELDKQVIALCDSIRRNDPVKAEETLATYKGMRSCNDAPGEEQEQPSIHGDPDLAPTTTKALVRATAQDRNLDNQQMLVLYQHAKAERRIAKGMAKSICDRIQKHNKLCDRKEVVNIIIQGLHTNPTFQKELKIKYGPLPENIPAPIFGRYLKSRVQPLQEPSAPEPLRKSPIRESNQVAQQCPP